MLIPNKQEVGEPHIICDTHGYTLRSTGQRITTNMYGDPLHGDALAHAIRWHGFPGVVIRVDGPQLEGMQIGGGSPWARNTVIWDNGPVHDVTIIGGAEDRAIDIGNIQINHDRGGAGDLRLENLTLMQADSGAFSPFLISQNGEMGHLKMYDIDFDTLHPNTYSGKGMKWNLRGHGLARYDLRGINFHKAEEHGAYVDNIQGTSYFYQLHGSNMGRTMLQVTNRRQSGRTSYGTIVVADSHASHNHGHGGSDFSFFGHGGDVMLINCSSIGSEEGSHGAFTQTTDHGHGAYLHPELGYSLRGLLR